MPVYTTIASVVANDVLSTTYLNAIVDDFALWAEHDHSPCSGEGGSLLKVASATASAIERFYFSPATASEFESVVATGCAQLHVASLMLGANAWGFGITSQNACGDYARIKLPLFKGTYKIEMLYLPTTCGGTACLSLNTSDVGTVDTYGTAGSSLIKTITGVIAPSTASYFLQVQQVSSNASSTGCHIELGMVTVVKTSH